MTPIRTLRPLAKVVLSTQSDERLVALSRQGSEDAFAEIVRRHRPGLLRLARSLGTGDRADDVVQDGLVRAWRALQGSDAEIDLRPWLTTIVRNRALTSHSTTRIHEELDETIDGVRQPGDIVIMREELRSAVSAVNSLPETQREALVRSALSGESHDQIASALATTPGAVRQLIFRARTGLREAIGAIVPFPLVRALADIGGSGAGAAAGGTAAGGAAVAVNRRRRRARPQGDRFGRRRCHCCRLGDRDRAPHRRRPGQGDEPPRSRAETDSLDPGHSPAPNATSTSAAPGSAGRRCRHQRSGREHRGQVLKRHPQRDTCGR